MTQNIKLKSQNHNEYPVITFKALDYTRSQWILNAFEYYFRSVYISYSKNHPPFAANAIPNSVMAGVDHPKVLSVSEEDVIMAVRWLIELFGDEVWTQSEVDNNLKVSRMLS